MYTPLLLDTVTGAGGGGVSVEVSDDCSLRGVWLCAAIGQPQDGQLAAVSETCFAHSGQLMRATDSPFSSKAIQDCANAYGCLANTPLRWREV